MGEDAPDRATLAPDSVHDAVVLTIAHATRGYAVYTNTGTRRAVCVAAGPAEIYPDVLLCDAESFIARHVIEVETEDSVDATRVARWTRIAQTRQSFWLLVPPRSLLTAARLCRRARIPAHLGTWSVDSAGNLSVGWLTQRIPAGFVRAGTLHHLQHARARAFPV